MTMKKNIVLALLCLGLVSGAQGNDPYEEIVANAITVMEISIDVLNQQDLDRVDHYINNYNNRVEDIGLLIDIRSRMK